MKNNILLVGKRIHGHHLIVTKGMLSTEQLIVMNNKGWILSRMNQQKANFHYDFVRLHRTPKAIGW